MAKDLRTRVEVGDVDKVLDGALEPFIRGFLKMRREGGVPVPVEVEDEVAGRRHEVPELAQIGELDDLKEAARPANRVSSMTTYDLRHRSSPYRLDVTSGFAGRSKLCRQ